RAGVWLEVGRADQALACLDAVDPAAVDPVDAAEVGYLRGQTLLASGRLAEAELALTGARAGFVRANRRRSIAGCDNLLADLARSTGDLATAEDRYRAALTVYEPLWGSDAAVVGANLGLVLLARGQVEAADAAFSRAAIVVHRLGWRVMETSLLAARAACAAANADWPAFDTLLAAAAAPLDHVPIADPEVVALMERAAAAARAAGEGDRAVRAESLAAVHRDRLRGGTTRDNG
ncbi:MAG: hypothetical protein ABMB14_18040, partial [Myxococcota bacterium]